MHQEKKFTKIYVFFFLLFMQNFKQHFETINLIIINNRTSRNQQTGEGGGGGLQFKSMLQKN